MNPLRPLLRLHRSRRCAATLALVLGSLLLAGCGLLKPGAASPAPPPPTPPLLSTEPESRLRIGDQIQIRLETTSLQPAQVLDLVIDDEGKIGLPLINRIQADGFTSAELAAAIQKAYVPRYYMRCSANVLIASRFFYVGGEVRSPNRYPWSTDMTLLKAVNTAGGFTDFASRGKVELTRGKTKSTFDLEYLRRHPERDVPIQPGDTIYVPRSIL